MDIKYIFLIFQLTKLYFMLLEILGAPTRCWIYIGSEYSGYCSLFLLEFIYTYIFSMFHIYCQQYTQQRTNNAAFILLYISKKLAYHEVAITASSNEILHRISRLFDIRYPAGYPASFAG